MIKLLKNLHNSSRFHYLLILLVSILIVSPVLFVGIPYGNNDFVHHLQISNAFYDSLRQGIFYPNWVAQENFGYGAVTVRFYPPLVNYSLAVFRILTGGWQSALFATFAFWSFIGGIGIYIWTRDFFKVEWRSSVAAILFVFAPYHLNQFYNSFMFGEFAALSVLPFCFYFAKKLCDREKLTDVLGFGVSLALIILSNLPQTILSTLCLGLYILFNLKRPLFYRQVFRFILGGLLALSVSAFYWVRLIVEMNLIHISQPNTDPAYDYRNHFLLSNFSFDTQGVWLASIIFLMSVLICLASLIVSGKIKSLKQNKNIKHICLISLTAIFMMLPVSRFIWENALFLQKVQFPWRFLSVLTLFTSVILAYCTEFITPENLRKKRPLIILLVGIIFIFLTFSIKQVIFGAAFLEPPKFAPMIEQSASRRGLQHWLPVWADNKTFTDRTKVSANGRNTEIKIWESEKKTFFITEGVATKARIAILYYPHWHAYINGKAAEVSAGVDGAVNIELPEPVSEVELVFIEPQYSLLSRKVSVTSVIFVFLLFIYQFISRRRSNAE